MKKFMDDNFLLNNEVAVKLYHDIAKDMPIFDYHCHLSPKEIWEDKSYENITEVWLYGDHYKWRAMRSNGVDEDYITGNKSDYEKFMAWAKTVPECIGNPLYHWTHLELKRYFGIEDLLSEETADAIWHKCNTIIQSGEFSARQLIKSSHVTAIGTTDDPVDSLAYHSQLKEDKSMDTRVFPTFRPDKGVEIGKETFMGWLKTLEDVVGKTIDSYEIYLEALTERLDFFQAHDCCLSDHALENVPYRRASQEELNIIFNKKLQNQPLSDNEINQFRTEMLLFFGRAYGRRNWVMQLHIGALRNNNESMLNRLGPDTGFDSIADHNIADNLSKLLNALNEEDALPKTILYTLNPKDNYVLGTMLGNFQDGRIPGKIQFGSGWWFNDQKDGMIRQMVDLSNLGLLSRFVGMLTDSRSFLSYTRHEYFRRILCNLVGEWVVNGEYPYDEVYLDKIIRGICYDNAKTYFKSV